MQTKTKIVMSTLALACAAAGCADQGSTGSAPKIGGQDQAIIGGVPANSPKLNAIGTLGIQEVYTDEETGETITYYQPICTASLISPVTVLTAKHCVAGIEEYSYYGYYQFVFGIGPDGFNPIRKVPIISVQREPNNDVAGVMGLGHDVSVVHLGEPVTDLVPVKFAALDKSMIGQRLAAIGYGEQNIVHDWGTRFAGNVTVNATQGKLWELVFGSLDGFKDYLNEMGGYGENSGGDSDAGTNVEDGGVSGGDGDSSGSEDWYVEYLYDSTKLLPGYEAYVGNKPGDVQACFGDSGGPLVKTDKTGAVTAYGVTSGTLNSSTAQCDYGNIYGAFGPKVITFLNKAKAWTDPCAHTSTAGSCSGDTVTRCTNWVEGDRRVISTDCSLLGQTCGVTASGQAVCVTPGEEPVDLNGVPNGVHTEKEVNELNQTLLSRANLKVVPPKQTCHK
jgi:hypothetical protein